MSRSKKPEIYPPLYRALLERARGKPEGITIPFGTKQELMKTRAGIYAYVNAVAKQEEEREIMYELRVSPAFHQIGLSVHGMELRLLDKDFDPGCMAIRKALEGIGADIPLRTDVDAATRAAALADMQAHEASAPTTASGDLDYRALLQRPDAKVDEPVEPSKGFSPPGFDPANYKD